MPCLIRKVCKPIDRMNYSQLGHRQRRQCWGCWGASEEGSKGERERGRRGWANTQSWSNLDKSIYSHARNHIYLHAYFMNLMFEGYQVRIGQTKQTTHTHTGTHTRRTSDTGYGATGQRAQLILNAKSFESFCRHTRAALPWICHARQHGDSATLRLGDSRTSTGLRSQPFDSYRHLR